MNKEYGDERILAAGLTLKLEYFIAAITLFIFGFLLGAIFYEVLL